MSKPQAIRHINEIRTMQSLADCGPMSRAGLARHLGLTRATAGSIVADLIQAGLVVECDDAQTSTNVRAGRPGSLVGLNAQHAVFLGAEIGVDRICLMAIDLAAKQLACCEHLFAEDRSSPDAVLDQLALMVKDMLARLSARSNVMGLNITVPGLMGIDGRLLRAPILGWIDVPVLDMLRTRIGDGLSLGAENDANALALADQYSRGDCAPRDAVYLYMDSGIGGALICEGRLWRGSRGFAGEIGHIYAGENADGVSAPVANSLETFIGKEALLRRLAKQGLPVATIDALPDLLNAGNEIAVEIIGQWGFHLGRGLAALTSVLDPHSIILGGPMAALFHHCEEQVRQSIAHHLAILHPVPDIAIADGAAASPARGAALMLRRRMFSFDDNLVFNQRRGG